MIFERQIKDWCLISFLILFSLNVTFRHLPFGLVHIALLATCIILIWICVQSRAKIFKDTIIFCVLIFYLFLNILITDGYIKHSINLISSLFCFILFSGIGFTNSNFFENTKNKFSFFTVINLFFILELITRISATTSFHKLSDLKEKSYFYLDTNFVGLVLLANISLMVYLYGHRVQRKLNFFVICVLLILTFSRAAWLALILSLPLIQNYRRGKSISVQKYWIYLSTLILGLFLLQTYLVLDGSLNKKFIMYGKIVHNYLNGDLLEKLVGFGANSSVDLFGSYAHSIFLVFINDFGLIGLILLLLALYRVTSKSPPTMLLILPYVLAATSVFSYGSHVVFGYLGLIYGLQRSKEQDEW